MSEVIESEAAGIAAKDLALPGAASEKPLRSRALRASAWVIGSRPLGMALQLLRSMILTRLLFPEAFGLMALVSVVMQGLQMCSDVGIGPSIIKSARGNDEAFLQTAWTLQIIRGGGLWLLCCALAWPAAHFYHEPMLLALLPVAGVNVLISGFGSTAWAVHDREMKRGRLTLIAYLAQMLNLGAMIFFAWWLRSVWALVIGGLSETTILLVMGHTCLPGIRHRLRWERAAVHELVHFGKWVFASTLLTFFAMQLDKLMLGKLIPMALLGVYSISLVLANLPRDLVQQIVSLVLFPVMSAQFRADTTRMHERFSHARGIILRVGLLLCLGVVVVAPVFFHALYDARYAAASSLARLLAMSAWITILNATSGYALLALGDSKSLTFSNVANVVVTVAGAYAGFHLLGLPGFIGGYAAGTSAGELVAGWMLRRHGLGVFRQDIAMTLIGLTMATACLLMNLVPLHMSRALVEEMVRSALGLVIWTIGAGFLLPPVLRQVAPKLKIPLLRRRIVMDAQ